MPVSPSATPRTRPSSLACTECRKHHVKCDSKRPSCSRCAAAQSACVFLPSRRGGRRRPENSQTRVSGTHANKNQKSPLYSRQRSTDMPVKGDSVDRFSRIYHSDGVLSCEFSLESIVPENRLIRLFYENFHSAHPVLVPASLYEKWGYPPYLQQVVKFIGSHYSMVLNNDVLHEATRLAIEDAVERTPGMVKARLLYSIIMRARNETSQAEYSLSQAIDIAIELGMHGEDYATAFSGGREHEAESLRRTWWELFTWEVYTATLYGKSTLRCSGISSNVWLPCEESTYASLCTIPQPQSLASFRTRAFMEDEEISRYSSFAYRIEAVCILARVLVLNSLPETHHDHLQAVANTVVSWIHHLPQQKVDIVDMYGNVDEMLFQAHFTIQYAAMLLHLPRSNIRPSFPHPSLLICPMTPLRLSPSVTRHVHDVKTIEASKKLSNLLSIRSSALSSSPLVVLGSILCGLVQLAATERHGRECYDHHHNRVVLVLGCLKLLRDKWSLAEEAHSHLKNIAAEIATTSTPDPQFESKIMPSQENQRPFGGVDETDTLFTTSDNAMGDRFSRLLSEFIDPTCGDSFPLFPMSDSQSFLGDLNP